MKLFLMFSVFICLTTSCRIQGLTNDYSKLTDDQKKRIIPLENFEETKPKMIYTINAKQLKDELKKYPKAIVYTFANGCPSKTCKPLIVYEDYAKNNGFKLFLVMVGYSNLSQTTVQNFESPLFMIDNEYYNTKSRTKYVTYFKNELMNKPLENKHKEYLGSLLFYENGNFKSVYKYLPN